MIQSTPMIIQGGMGVGVSAWRLARAVSRAGHLGVVAGTALDVLLVRRLQSGDPGGHMRRALAYFPVPGAADRILDRYFVPGGRKEGHRFKASPLPTRGGSRPHSEFVVAANFVEVFLARQGHGNPVGSNYLEKIQLPTLPSLFGAMLAGVDFVLMGGGIPRAIPRILDCFARADAAELRLDVKGASPDEAHYARFDPMDFCGGDVPNLIRPKFLAIIASTPLARMLAKKSGGGVDGFVIEGPTAGGHNAPPRGRMRLDAAGEPIYAERDEVDLDVVAGLGLPFWLAGSYGQAGRLKEAIALGAAGIQVGTAFAYCRESGIAPHLKQRVLDMVRCAQSRVLTDPAASPTGFPFKVVRVPDTLSESSVYRERTRVCDLGFLRHAYKREDGELGWRCPGEPVDAYVRKGGAAGDTTGKKCLCNGLLANVGLGQLRGSGYEERPLLTSGDDLATVAQFLPRGADSYGAQDVLTHLLTGVRGTS